MSPDKVRLMVERNFPKLIAKERKASDGYAFYLGSPRGGSESNRIIRAVQYSKNGPVKLKLAISTRVERKNKEISFEGGEEALVELIKHEIKLYEERLGKA